MTHLNALEPALAALGGTVSVWYGPVGGPAAYQRLTGVPHYPASTMKLAVLVAAYRLADAGGLDLDTEVPVHSDFASAAPGAGRFTMDPDYDSDPDVWALAGDTALAGGSTTGPGSGTATGGGTATLRWLARRMIVRSSNLATNLVLEHTGYPVASDAWRLAGGTHSVVRRGIEDYAARDSGLDNVVTAADLAALLGAIADDRIASRQACREMRDVLLAQEKNDDLPSGLPPGTPIAHKSGWVDGIRHDAGIVHPPDAPPYLLVACLTADLTAQTVEDADRRMRLLMRRIAAASWADRRTLAHPAPPTPPTPPTPLPPA